MRRESRSSDRDLSERDAAVVGRHGAMQQDVESLGLEVRRQTLGEQTVLEAAAGERDLRDVPPAPAAGESRDGLSGLLESTLEQVVRKAPISVLAVRNRPHAPYRALRGGTDFTDEAQQALGVAARLFPAADITLMHAHQMAYAGLLENASQSSESEAEHRARLRAHIEDTDLTPERKGSIHTRVDVGAPAAVLQRAGGLAGGGRTR